MSLFADDLTVFVGNLIEFTKKEILWKTQGILERVQDTKLIYKSQFISYVSERTSGIWNLNHFILCISTQKMKYLAIKLTKYIQDLREENKNLWRMKWKKKKKPDKWSNIPCVGRKTQYCEDISSSQLYV